MSPPKTVTSRSNPAWQALRKLAQQPGAYRAQGRVWVEGEHLCEEAFRRGQAAALAVIAEPAWEAGRLRPLAESAREVMVLPTALMAGLSAMDSPPPIAFVLPWSRGATVQPGVATVVLDRLQDAGNVGTILRSAAAFGCGQVIALEGCAALWSPKVLRAGMGAHWALHLVEEAGQAALDALALPLLATSSHAEATIDRTPLPWPAAWCFGHEGQGLDPGLQSRCDQSLRIPQRGGLESLNVATAAAVCLYEAARQRGAAKG
jgi:TrmH family RNA methyltransferase